MKPPPHWRTTSRPRGGHQHLKDGGAVIIFPAGAISLAPNVVGKAIDTDWKTFAAKLAMTPDTTTVPFFSTVEIRSSIKARRISVTRYSLMFREICKKIGQPITVHVRQPVQSDQLCALGSRQAITQRLRDLTYGASYSTVHHRQK